MKLIFAILLAIFLAHNQGTLLANHQSSDQAVPLTKVLNTKILATIDHAVTIPGLQEEEVGALKSSIAEVWEALLQVGSVEVSGTDEQIRPVFVALQGIIEQVLAAELQHEVRELKGIIHTPMPATPLCTNGDISQELVDPSIALDPARLCTVKGRTTIVRDFLLKGGELYIIYPQEGLYLRTQEQQTIYSQALKEFPGRLFDRPISSATIPSDLIGATYLFKDRSGQLFVFAIKMTQAKDPQATGHFGLWFGPVQTPAIEARVEALASYLKEYTSDIFTNPIR